MANSKPPRSESPDDLFCLENVDLTEQAMIQAQISRKSDDLSEQQLQEALRLSLGETGMLTVSDITSGLSSVDIDSDTNGSSVTVPADDGAAAAAFSYAAASADSANLIDLGSTSTNDQDTSVTGSLQRGQHQQQSGHEPVNGRASEEHLSPDRTDLDLASAVQSGLEGRSERRSSLERTDQYRSERRPSLERAYQYRSERRPSFEQTGGYRSERRPSLERAYQNRSERRPSLERTNDYRSERRLSLERSHQYRSERRPSLERVHQYRSERRPSLDRAHRYNRHDRSPSPDRAHRYRHEGSPSPDRAHRNRHDRSPSPDQARRNRHDRSPSPDGSNSHRAQRRPSLERLKQNGLKRRPSQELLQGAAERAQSLAEGGASSGSGQGINTLHPPGLNEDGIPKNWDLSQMPEAGERYRLVQLSPMDSEYSAITVDFEEAGLKVHTVERLQNLEILEIFNLEKSHLLKHRPSDFALNERYLYHGTQAEYHRLCEEGLDFRLSFQGCFGNGSYFSDNPRKCMQYARRGDAGDGSHPMILVCRVILGESKVYDAGLKDSCLKREPEKPRSKSKCGQRFFDSVQGVPIDYPEFVVYRNNRSMIEYIVTFEEVAHRSPPTHQSFYRNQAPVLYKCEPIVLPIPEDELDKLYMLGPDTDSDGSCDEHTREVEMLRENVKRGKAKRMGIPFRLPTKEEKRYERLHWKRVCYYSCPPGSPLYDAMIYKKKEEKEARKKKKAEKKAEEAAAAPASSSDSASGSASTSEPAERSTSSNQATASQDQYDLEDESVTMVLDSIISDFFNATVTDDVEVAKRYIMKYNMDLNQALDHYYKDNP